MADYAVGLSLQGQVVDYLRTERGIRTNEEIREAIGHDSQECINTTLCRMHRFGYVERISIGRYRIAPQYAIQNDAPERVLVSATLDLLQAQYPRVFRQELHKRGWSQ